jgi:hypothetical protein
MKQVTTVFVEDNRGFAIPYLDLLGLGHLHAAINCVYMKQHLRMMLIDDSIVSRPKAKLLARNLRVFILPVDNVFEFFV